MHAAIDIGTNSIHLVVARATPGGGFDVVTTEKDMVRLGSGAGDMKNLAPEAIDRGIDALARMVEVAQSFGAEITAVATSAVREAENRQVFVDRARHELGLSVEVISGYEEARLIHHGVIHALPVAGRRTLLVDIGGGSTEFIVGENSELVEARSLRLGAIRLNRRFIATSLDDEGVASAKAIKRCRVFLADALSGVARDFGGHRPELAIGSSGTITAVASMIAASKGPIPKQMNGFSFTRNELSKITEQVVGSSADERRKMRGLDERRTDIVVAGVLLLEAIFDAFGLNAMTLSEFALREGVLYDRFPAGADHLHDLRRSNAVRLGLQLDPDFAHAETAARLAVQIFDRTTELHGLGEDARELLETAGLVHNVGMFIAHSGHHKHGYYVIRNSEQLTGFSEQETELVALIARYHRKSHPTTKHVEFAKLDADDQQLVRILAGMLRIAIGLDRRHAAHVASVGVRSEVSGADGDGSQKDGDARPRLIIEPVVPNGSDIAVEIFAASARSGLLSEALDIDVVVQQRGRNPVSVESS